MDLYDGMDVQCYPNGQIAYQGNVENGNKVGTWRGYHENGEIAYETTYVDGLAEGQFTQFHDNGQLKISGSYQNGEKAGSWRHYTSSGELEDQFEFEIKSKKDLTFGLFSLSKLDMFETPNPLAVFGSKNKIGMGAKK